jgi:hypothetical protein
MELRRLRALYALAAVLLSSALMVPETIRNALDAKTDYPAHLTVTAQMLAQHALLLPYFVWAGAVIAIKLTLVNVPLPVAAIIASSAFEALTALVVYAALVRLSGANDATTVLLCGAATVCIMVVEPITLFTYPNVYFGYLIPNAYHNPTIIALRPFAIITFLATVHLLEDAAAAVSSIVVTAAASLVSTLSKPNYALCLIPSAVMLAAAKGARGIAVIASAFAPTVGLLAWQYNFHYGGSGSTKLVLAPLFVFTCGGVPAGSLGYRFVLSIAYPLAVSLCFPSSWRTTYVRLAWFSFAIAAIFTYFMAELTPSGLDCGGNFAWGTQIASFILFVAATAFLLGRVREKGLRWLAGGCIATFALHVISGVIFYIRTLNRPWPP